MSNFGFLDKHSMFRTITPLCKEAESALGVSNAIAALSARRALESAVKWMYSHDSTLEVPYQDNLSALIHDYKFKDLIDERLFPRIKFIITLGNKAAHQSMPMRRDESVKALENLFHFMRWITYAYGGENCAVKFEVGKLAGSAEYERKTKAIQDEFREKKVEWEAEKKKLEELLLSKEEREEVTQKREENEQKADFACEDISEFKTRKVYIDLALEMAGWEIGADCREEVEVSGMKNASGVGFVDYVLYAADGKPLAVVEAKRAAKDPKIGKVQAKLYADCLEEEYGVRPLIYYTNGFEYWLWEDAFYPERRVSGIATRDSLDWYRQRVKTRKDISAVKVNDEISNRPYQKAAIQAVCENLSKAQRKSLLVMATGAGKTRTAISIVDVLTKNNWIKNVLFLADRRELVKQAKQNFSKLLPHHTICNLLEKKTEDNSLNSRIIFSTYPTIMNAIDVTKKDDGSTLFTVGHFDLIIIDESHRSIYKKYQDIFAYFDSYLLGLTATPKSDIGKNTYGFYDIENGVPTHAYTLDEAIRDEWLVPYRVVNTTLKFLTSGVKYDELSDEEQEEWEDKIGEEIDSISSNEVNRILFNDNTVDTVIQALMNDGIKIEGGDKIGKTIIFAANTKHAEYILGRFNKLYPHYAGKFAATIYNGVNYVDSLIDDFKEEDKFPQIAVSVDMLDTGIDVPSIVNLVFFKKVRSKAKFHQMIGRGTRLCEDLFGIGEDKDGFRIFDYCSNFEFFKENTQGIETRPQRSLSECLFIIKTEIAKLLEHATYQEKEYINHRKELVTGLAKEVYMLDDSSLINRLHLKYIHEYRDVNAWQSISDKMLADIKEHIAQIVIPSTEDELKKRFDYLMYAIEHACLDRKQPAPKNRRKLQTTAEKLEEKGNLPQVQRNLEIIEYVQSEEYWENASVFDHERVRIALRELVVLLERENAATYFTNFMDEVLEVQEIEGVYTTDEFVSYRRKVEAYLKEHQDDFVVYKLRHNETLNLKDVEHLEDLLWNELGSENDYKTEYGEQPLLELAAKLVGLDRNTAQGLFSEFLSDNSLNSNQINFVSQIVDYIEDNGVIDKKVLHDHPFNQQGSIAELFENKLHVVTSIAKILDAVNERVRVG